MKTTKRSTRFIVALFFVCALFLAAYSRTTASGTLALVNGDFAGRVGTLVDFGLSTDGQNVIAYLCDGTNAQQTLAEWFKGPVTNNSIDITDAHGVHLVASLTPQAATITITLTDGSSMTFNAPSIPDPSSEFGLYRSEQTVNDVHYVGGWITPLPNPPNPDPTCCVPSGRDRGAIINELTGTLLPSPAIADFPNPMSLEVPNLGTFIVRLCRKGQC